MGAGVDAPVLTSPLMSSQPKMPLFLKTFLPGRWRPPVPAAAETAPSRPPADAVPRHPGPVEYTVEESSSLFRVFASRGERVIGVCVASSHAQLDVCFVSNVNVPHPSDRGQGVGSELVRQAWRHSGCRTVMPVNVVRESALWWAKLATSETIPVQLGVSYSQEHMLRFAVDVGSSASPVAPSSPEAPARAGAQTARLDGPPELVVKATLDHFRVPTAPSPSGAATFYTGAGEAVGTVQFGLSPLGDRVYVYDIRVEDAHRRCGYATAMLWHLAREYGQPITPVRLLHAASAFWNHARSLAGEGMLVTETVWDLEAEITRWAHLRPEADRLNAQILARLYEAHEPWAVAVGRGLEAEVPAPAAAVSPRAVDCEGMTPC